MTEAREHGTRSSPPLALTIAGSDPSAGAGIQADLKTFEALGVYGLTVVTCLTAQNTCGISAMHPLPRKFITAQTEALFSDFSISAIKTGILTSAEMIEGVAVDLRKHAGGIPIVIDPVIAASTGAEFMDDAAREALISDLAPMATLITPNLDEAAAILELPQAETVTAMEAQAQALQEKLKCGAILLKGGHLEGTNEATDIFYDGQNCSSFSGPFIETRNSHGTGCTLSAAITSKLAYGHALKEAISLAKEYVRDALRGGADWHIGAGSGPIAHNPSRDREIK